MAEKSKIKIALVDDEPDLVKLATMRLESAGYEVVSAVDGQDGLELVKKTSPDLIILDLMMPRLDGYKVCRLLKFDQRFEKIPVLILTARSQEEDIKLASECGASAYLTKPFEPDVFLAKVKELLEKAPPAES